MFKYTRYTNVSVCVCVCVGARRVYNNNNIKVIYYYISGAVDDGDYEILYTKHIHSGSSRVSLLRDLARFETKKMLWCRRVSII